MRDEGGLQVTGCEKNTCKTRTKFFQFDNKIFATELHRVVENHRVIPSVQLFFSAALCGFAVQKSSERASFPINRDETR